MPASRLRLDPAWIVWLAGVSAALHVGKLPPAVPALQQALGVTLVQAGFLLSLVQAGSMLLGLVAGLTAERVGLRRCMLAGLALLSTASLAGGWAQGAGMLLVLRALEGMGVLMTTIPAPGLMRRVVPPGQLTRMLGVWGAYMPLGTALALLLGPFAIGAAGWSAWWWLTAGVSAGMGLALWRRVPADPSPESRPPAGAAGWLALPWRTLQAGGPWLGALTFAAYSASWLAVIGFLPTLYVQAGWAGPLAAVLTASVAGGNMIGNIGAGRLLHGGARPQVLMWTGFATMAAGAWLAFSAATTAAPVLRYLGALLFSVVGGLIPGTLFALAPRLAPDDRTISTTVGWMLQWAALGQVCGPPLVAWVAAAAGGWHWTWALTGACCAAGAMVAGHVARWTATPARSLPP